MKRHLTAAQLKKRLIKTRDAIYRYPFAQGPHRAAEALNRLIGELTCEIAASGSCPHCGTAIETGPTVEILLGRDPRPYP